MMISTGMNAKRFAGKPIRQPTYNFREIPRCERDLQGSLLQEIQSRDNCNDSMAEFVLLCNETMRRNSSERQQAVGKRYSKPLSLEYIADRLDIDDPMFGYMVRTDVKPDAVDNDAWKRGMLQGFIIITTFTNWQKTFRWDSMHDSAFAYDDENLAHQMQSGERVYDTDGTLAEELQSTVRCGDPWNEGIVWPRIAEISLLGGMGCGKALVSLAIEKLECMKACGQHNYDYVALQATDNSIPFYESMGFVRVGCITEDDKYGNENQPDKTSPLSRRNSDASFPSEIVSSPTITYVTEKPGETLAEVAKKFNVDVWDIIFLNHFIFKDINPRSRLMKDTSLFIPSMEDAKADATSRALHSHNLRDASAPQWYICQENDTPRMISKKFNVACSELVKANRERHPELQSVSRLKEGTRIKVSHFHLDDDKHVPYCHWTFPDDTFGQHHDPSYMMVKRLNRRKGAAARVKPVESSFAVPVTPYTAPPSELFAIVEAPTLRQRTAQRRSAAAAVAAPRANEPKRPKRTPNPFMVYCSEQREIMKDKFVGMQGKDILRALSKMWQDLPEKEKAPYKAKHQKEAARYQREMERYKKDLASFHRKNPGLVPAAAVDDDGKTLYNKVVKLNSEGLAQSGSEFEYYFVLTYVPDLHWCHLAPMVQVGVWGPGKPSRGRPIWMLVDETHGKEVDISGAFCIPVRSRAIKRTVDADKEQWDILDHVVSPTALSKLPVGSPKRKRGRPRKHPLPADPLFTVSPALPAKKKRRSAIQPKKLGRPRKNPLPTTSQSPLPSITGSPEPTKKKRGRPRKHPLPAVATESRAVADPGSIESKKRGRPRKNPLPDLSTEPRAVTNEPKKKPRGRPRKKPPPKKKAKRRRIGSDTEDDEWDPDAEMAPAPSRRGRPPRRSAAAAKSLARSDADGDDWQADAEKLPTATRGRPTPRSYSATKPLTGTIVPKRKRGRPPKQTKPVAAAESSETESKSPAASSQPRKKLGRPRKHPLPDADASIETESPPLESPPASSQPKKKLGRPRKYPLPDADPSIETEPPPAKSPSASSQPKKKRGRPRKHPLPGSDASIETESPPAKSPSPSPSASNQPKKRGRPRRHPLPDANASIGTESPPGKSLSASTQPKKKLGRPRKHPLPDVDASIETESPPAKSASSQPKKKLGRPRKHPLPDVDASIQTESPPAKSASSQPKKKRGRPRKHPLPDVDASIETESPPAKRRKLPRRNAAPAFGSSRNEDKRSAVESLKTAESVSPFRTVALTRSAKKLSMTSPLMFGPRAGVCA